MTSKQPPNAHHAEPTLREIVPKPMDWKVVSICCLCALILAFITEPAAIRKILRHREHKRARPYVETN